MKQSNSTVDVLKWQEGSNLLQFSRKQIFDAVQSIDHTVFHDNGWATEESDIERYEAYKDSYIFVLDGNKIVGYMCYFPITEEFYSRIVHEQHVYDGDVSPKDVCPVAKNATNYIFVLSVALLPEYQKKGVSKRMSEMALNAFSAIRIKDMVSYAYTIEGEHFLNVLGMKAFKEMGDGIKLMRMN
jgi:GNAT superfamily N-acetyltransferase